MQQRLARQERPDGYNVGVTIRAAGGQTVGHAHIHLIRRYAGDIGGSCGGIRWILSAKARYWEK
jgi:diadenosine tetraphosphate (Ap4A) HIT family hydrolase